MILSLVVLTVLAALAAGCSGIQLPWAKGNTQSQQNPADFSAQPVENKLAVGILKLEGTNNAVTAEEAQKLLPLWKAVRGLANDTKTTTEEMTGLYK